MVPLTLPRRASLTEHLFKDYIQWIPRVGVLCILTWITFDFGGHHYRPEGLLRFATLILACFWLLVPFRTFPSLKYVGWPLALFLLSSFISTLFSAYFHDSFLEWFNIICYLLIFLMVYDLWSEPRLHYFLIHFLLMLGVGACCIGMYYKVAYPGGASTMMSQSGLHSTFYQADVFGGFLILLFPVAFVMFLDENNPVRVFLYGMISCFFGFCLVLTFSRGAWLSLMAALCLLLLMILLKKSLLPRFGLLLMKTVSMAMVMVVMFFLFNQVMKGHTASPVSDRLKQRATELFSEGDSSRTARFQFWHAAIQISLHHPLLGTGLKTFGRFYPPYEDDIRHFSKYTHNLYLQFAAELGWIATILFMVVVALRVWTFFRLLRLASGDRFLYSSHLGILIGALAAFCHHFVDVDWFFPALPAIWLTLFASSMGRIIKAGEGEKEVTERGMKDILIPGLSRHMALQFSLCILFMVLSLVISVPFFSQRYAEAAEIMRKTGHPDKAVENYTRASQINPFNSEYHRSLADLYYLKAMTGTDFCVNLDRAEQEIKIALKLDPARSVLYHFLGKLYTQKGAHNEALSCFEKAIQLDGKNYPGFYNDIANYYVTVNDFEKAEEYYLKAHTIFSGDVLRHFWFFRAGPTKVQLSETCLGLGNIYIKKKQLDKAEKFLKESLELQAENFSALFGLGYVSYQKGDYRLALLNFSRCTKAEPRFALAYLFSALSYEKLGDTALMEKNLKKAYELDPRLKTKNPAPPSH